MPIELLDPHSGKSETGEKYRSCVLCGNYYKRVELPFDSGSTEPTADETLTGATSTDTMVVTAVTLVSGTWAGGDAAGIVEGKAATGRAFDSRSFFQNNENLNGSVAGNNCLTANGTGAEKIYGRLYRESQLVKRNGKWFCIPHYDFRFRHKDMDEQRFRPTDDERGATY